MPQASDRRKPARDTIVMIVTFLVSAVLIFLGNRYAVSRMTALDRDPDIYQKARVTQVLRRASAESEAGFVAFSTGVNITFEAELLGGAHEGEIVTAVQNTDPDFPAQIRDVQAGDRVILQSIQNLTPEDRIWSLTEYVRTDDLLILGSVFFALLILFGRGKGFRTIVSLGLTCLAVFLVFIPAVLAGFNIYVWSVLICVFITASTLLVVYGACSKTVTSALGCIGGVLVSGLLTFIMDRVMQLTGMTDEESMYLLLLYPEHPIDLRAVIFSAIIIGAVGAIMDVSISISSALQEIRDTATEPSFRLLVRSGFNIGRDMMGTMANTLVLAYIGSALSMVLLLSASADSILQLLNREMIVVEILQALVGSIGILFTIPLTTLVCALLYTGKRPGHRGETAIRMP